MSSKYNALTSTSCCVPPFGVFKSLLLGPTPRTLTKPVLPNIEFGYPNERIKIRDVRTYAYGQYGRGRSRSEVCSDAHTSWSNIGLLNSRCWFTRGALTFSVVGIFSLFCGQMIP